ncbi:ABC transporter substrate-binding protein [Salinisphaera orenii]|uniref:Toluene tolerance protein n=1 Tax=Salinisphaera orenii YIM 95161 TaxID=1051139 RepID=A0A423PDU6_9GAMM|nr:ABC transporter substrate-binding protein [Salinisphaera halophila]ROO23750.1 hypothetical protein SAHL_16660 [Salinisphaera halophila YIM 95161]
MQGLKQTVICVVATLVICACIGVWTVAAAEPARATVERVNSRVLIVMKQAEELGFAGRYRELASTIEDNFDIERLARRTLGKQWRALDAAQQATWVDQFGRYLIRAYAQRFDRDGGRHFEITGARDVDRGRRQVEVALVGDDDERTPIRYVLANRGGDWRIVDIIGRFAETLGLDSDRRAAAVREHGAAAFLDRFERRLEAGPELPQA